MRERIKLTRIPLNPIRKIAKQLEVERVTKPSLEVASMYLELIAKQLIVKAVMFMENSKRTTLMERDIKSAYDLMFTDFNTTKKLKRGN